MTTMTRFVPFRSPRKIGTSDGFSMAMAIINLGRSLGMKIIAEGVETEQEATILERIGCEVAQGFYFSQPVPEACVKELIEQHLRPGAPAVFGAPNVGALAQL